MWQPPIVSARSLSNKQNADASLPNKSPTDFHQRAEHLDDRVDDVVERLRGLDELSLSVHRSLLRLHVAIRAVRSYRFHRVARFIQYPNLAPAELCSRRAQAVML